MIPFSHFNLINRRKQISIIKFLVPLALFVIIFMLVWSRSSVSRKKVVHSSKKETVRKLPGSDFLGKFNIPFFVITILKKQCFYKIVLHVTPLKYENLYSRKTEMNFWILF